VSTTVQARLDPETQKTLDSLVRHLGLTPSEVVREGVKLLGRLNLPRRRRKIIGLGKFDSGIPDLATNPKYMEDYGR
jgi:hypothetical protein